MKDIRTLSDYEQLQWQKQVIREEARDEIANKEESSIYLEGLKIIEENISWSEHRIKFLKSCLEEEQEELKKYKKEREKIIKRLEECGIKCKGYKIVNK